MSEMYKLFNDCAAVMVGTTTVGETMRGDETAGSLAGETVGEVTGVSVDDMTAV